MGRRIISTRLKVFSADAKDEIARVPFARDCCPRHFLFAFFALSRRSTKPGPDAAYIVRASRVSTARVVLKAATRANVRARAQQLHGARTREMLAVDVTIDEPLKFRLLTPSRVCCRRAWVRAAFLACGSVADPSRGYHLEFNTRDDAEARAVAAALASVGSDAGISRRRKKPFAYVKGGQAVADLLAQMGAAHAVLWLDDMRARRETKNTIRRTVNSEAANAARAGSAAARQLTAVRSMLHPSRLRSLSAPLREAARLRAAHPDMTLRELGDLARPAVTKSSMAYRLRQIQRLARFRAGETD